MTEDWLTVSQAAAQLGISERQARRYAARLAPEDREEGPDTTTDADSIKAGHEDTMRPARRPTRVRLEAMRAARDEATGRQNPQSTPEKEMGAPDGRAGRAPDVTTQKSDATPDTARSEAEHATAPSSTKPDDWAERAAEYRGEIQFLRGLVEQRDRDAAELRAALREALKTQPRQLMEGDSSSTKEKEPAETPVPARQIVAAPESSSSTKAPRETRQVQRRRAVRGLLRAFFGFVEE